MCCLMAQKNRGYTLLEVIMVMAICAIAFSVLVPVVSMVYRINHSANDMAQAQVLAQTVATQLNARLRYARSVSILDALPDDAGEGEEQYLYTLNGQVYERRGVGDILVSLDKGYAYRYRLKFTPGDAGVIKAQITVLGADGKIYDLTEPIYIHNLTTGSVGGLAEGSVVAYLPPAREELKVTSITVTADTNAITENEQTLALEADVYPLGATNRRVIWSVDDPAVAAVSAEGLLIPLTDGVVTVTATAADGSGVQGQFVVTVSNQEQKITALAIDSATGSYTMPPGGSLQIVALIQPEDAFNQQLDWKVDDTRYATISDDGLLTAKYLSGVSVIVTASTRDGSRLTRTLEILIE